MCVCKVLLEPFKKACSWGEPLVLIDELVRSAMMAWVYLNVCTCRSGRNGPSHPSLLPCPWLCPVWTLSISLAYMGLLLDGSVFVMAMSTSTSMISWQKKHMTYQPFMLELFLHLLIFFQQILHHLILSLADFVIVCFVVVRAKIVATVVVVVTFNHPHLWFQCGRAVRKLFWRWGAEFMHCCLHGLDFVALLVSEIMDSLHFLGLVGVIGRLLSLREWGQSMSLVSRDYHGCITSRWTSTDYVNLRICMDMDVRSWISMDMWMSHDIDMGAGWIRMLTTSKTTTTTTMTRSMGWHTRKRAWRWRRR